MTQVEKYSHIRSILTGVLCTNNQLNTLKQHFRNEILSERRYDRIQNLISLITILEKRDVVSPNDIGPLSYIANVLKNGDIIELIRSFNVPTIERESPNIVGVADRVEQVNVVRNLDVNHNIGRVLPVTPSDPERKVYNLICREIGQKWKDFARELNISEGFIDQLEYRHHNSIEEMTREVIVYHRENCDPRYWRFKLCEALITARRLDLSLKVQNIFAMHNVE